MSFARRVFASFPKRSVWNTIKEKSPMSREHIPPTALVVGVCALCFQIAVLYPWHEELSEQFTTLQAQTKSLTLTAEKLNAKVDDLIALESEVKAKEARILEREDAILAEETIISRKLDELLSRK